MWTSPQGVSRQPQRVINSSAFQRGPSVHDEHLQLQHSHQVKNWRKAASPGALSSLLKVARYKIPRRLLRGSGCTNHLLPLPGWPWFDLSSHPDGSYLEATEERGGKELRGNHPGTKSPTHISHPPVAPPYFSTPAPASILMGAANFLASQSKVHRSQRSKGQGYPIAQ